MYVAHAESAILTMSVHLSIRLLAQFLPPRATRQQNSQQVNFYTGLIFDMAIFVKVYTVF